MDEQEIIEYCMTKPEACLESAFGGRWTAIRHGINRKCFANIFERDGIMRANLRCQPLKADFLRQTYAGVAPGYRMSKDYWNEVSIGGDVPDQVLLDMIDESYQIAKPKQITGKPKLPKQLKPEKAHWPLNLYRAVFGEEFSAVPDNAEESIKIAMNRLRPREQAMLTARYHDERTFRDIGAEHGIVAARVSQINERSIRRLRNQRRSRYLLNLELALACDRFAETTSREERREMLVAIYGTDRVSTLESSPIDELHLSSLANSRLSLNGITTLADLSMLTTIELMTLRFISNIIYDEIMAACAKHGLSIIDSERYVRLAERSEP